MGIVSPVPGNSLPCLPLINGERRAYLCQLALIWLVAVVGADVCGLPRESLGTDGLSSSHGAPPKAAPRQEACGPPAPLLQLYQAPEAPERGFL